MVQKLLDMGKPRAGKSLEVNRMRSCALILLVLSATSIARARDFTPEECPVVGNTNSHIYHLVGQHDYAKMLREKKRGDNRKCFQTESGAQKEFYRRAYR
jgi:hypothetical protein